MPGSAMAVPVVVSCVCSMALWFMQRGAKGSGCRIASWYATWCSLSRSGDGVGSRGGGGAVGGGGGAAPLATERRGPFVGCARTSELPSACVGSSMRIERWVEGTVARSSWSTL